MGGLDTDHGHKLHINPDTDIHHLHIASVSTLPWYRLCRLLTPARGFLQFLLLVMAPLLVLVSPLQTLAAVGGARQTRVVTPETSGALPLSEDATDDALPR